MTPPPDAVFLDRDGTVIADAHYINDAKIPAIVVTNQSGIGRGLITVDDYKAVRDRFQQLLAEHGAHIDASYFCPDHPARTGPSTCRKPATKMFEDAIHDFDLNPANVAYVGDRWRDVAAAKTLGGRGILIPSHLTQDEDRSKAQDDGIESAPSLSAAIDMLFGLTPSGIAP